MRGEQGFATPTYAPARVLMARPRPGMASRPCAKHSWRDAGGRRDKSGSAGKAKFSGGAAPAPALSSASPPVQRTHPRGPSRAVTRSIRGTRTLRKTLRAPPPRWAMGMAVRGPDRDPQRRAQALTLSDFEMMRWVPWATLRARLTGPRRPRMLRPPSRSVCRSE